MESFKKHYQKSIGALPEWLHLAAHSHHPWPDVTEAAQLQAWQIAAHELDKKWNFIFEEVFDVAKKYLAKLLGVSDPQAFAFGNNTHELLYRVISCFPHKKIKVLSTDSEFYSATRQLLRLEEEGLIELTRVPVEPYQSFESRFAETAQKGFDLIFFSHVFFNSGYCINDLDALVGSFKSSSWVMVDGYHAVGAIPFSLKKIQDRVFYVGGGYKYLQSGEGACYLYVPPSVKSAKPVFTGWMADYGALKKGIKSPIGYDPKGVGWSGATYDASPWFRFRAVMQAWESWGLSVEMIRKYTQKLQLDFLHKAKERKASAFMQNNLLGDFPLSKRGQFLTFDFKSPDKAKATHDALMEAQVIVDFRDKGLRIGLGVYHEAQDLETFFDRWSKTKL